MPIQQVINFFAQSITRYWVSLLLIVWLFFVSSFVQGIYSETLPYASQDLLINYADGFVRRGMLGAALIATSQFLGIPIEPIIVVFGLIVSLSLFVATIGIGRLSGDAKIASLLLLAPFGLVVLAYDDQLGLRKETFGFLAIALYLLSFSQAQAIRRHSLQIVGITLFLTSHLAYEVVVFLLPSFVISIALGCRIYPKSAAIYFWQAVIVIALSIGLAVLSVVYKTADPETLCEAVLAVSSVENNNCGGPYYFLTFDTSEAIDFFQNSRSRNDYTASLMEPEFPVLTQWFGTIHVHP